MAHWSFHPIWFICWVHPLKFKCWEHRILKFMSMDLEAEALGDGWKCVIWLILLGRLDWTQLLCLPMWHPWLLQTQQGLSEVPAPCRTVSEVDVYQLPELEYFVTATVTNRLKGNSLFDWLLWRKLDSPDFSTCPHVRDWSYAGLAW